MIVRTLMNENNLHYMVIFAGKKEDAKFGWPAEVAVDDPVVIKLAEKYDRTPAQILLRQLIQRGIVVIPKSTNEERLAKNLNVRLSYCFFLNPDSNIQMNIHF